MQNQIEISTSPEGFVCKFIGPHSERVRDLFGTDTLPSAFTLWANPFEVIANIRAKNPDCYVYLKSEQGN